MVKERNLGKSEKEEKEEKKDTGRYTIFDHSQDKPVSGISVIFALMDQKKGHELLLNYDKTWLLRESTQGVGLLTVDYKKSNGEYDSMRLAFIPDPDLKEGEEERGQWRGVAYKDVDQVLQIRKVKGSAFGDLLNKDNSKESLFQFLKDKGFENDGSMLMPIEVKTAKPSNSYNHYVSYQTREEDVIPTQGRRKT